MSFPAGRYLSGTIHLRNGVTLHLESGARLIGTTNLTQYAQPTNNVMENVASPVTIWIKPGNTVGKVTVSGLNATGVYRSALSSTT